MTVTKSRFAYRIDRWTADGNGIIDHVAGSDDFKVAVATYKAACQRWPDEPITLLRQGTRVSRTADRSASPTNRASS